MKHLSIIIITAILFASCVKEITPTTDRTLTKSDVTIARTDEANTLMAVQTFDTKGKGATFSLGDYLPNDYRYISSGDRVLLFSDSVFVTGGDTVFLHGIFMPVHSVVPQNITFTNVVFKINNVKVPASISSNNGYISVTPNTITPIHNRLKFSVTGNAFGQVGISYYLSVDGFEITKTKTSTTLLPVEWLGLIHCSPTEFK